MTKLRLYNTLTKSVEELNPITPGKIGMYHCGPTVYSTPHIGNNRSSLLADILRRTCEHLGYTVDQVINITDVGYTMSEADSADDIDKIEREATLQHKTAEEITTFYTKEFYEQLDELNIRTEGTHFPRASKHIEQQIEFVKELEKLGHTYVTADGVYFDVSTWKEYGKLGQIDLSGLEAGKRIAHSLEKHTDYDFALWRFSPKDGKRQQEWESPWGVGFPGWHIECSAMSKAYLGETIDIHTGGVDLVPVHHNNEIAQSEAVSGKPLANIWMHGAFLNWKDKKMSKSDGSFVTLDDLKEKGISPLAFRYFLLQSKYRQPVFFDMESLEAASVAYTRLQAKIRHLWSTLDTTSASGQVNLLTEPLTASLTDDLNTAEAIAYIWDTIKDEKTLADYSRGDFEKFIHVIDDLLGLKLADSLVAEAHVEIPAEIQNLIDLRNTAKQNKDWTLADDIRNKITSLGYEVIDEKDGVRVVRR